jgi:hypothetical protein
MWFLTYIISSQSIWKKLDVSPTCGRYKENSILSDSVSNTVSNVQV